jgi:plasminogen activator inhibitor 1 RNA-binding protein
LVSQYPQCSHLSLFLRLVRIYSSREQSKGGRGAHAFGNEEQEAQQAEKDPASAEAPVEEGEDAAAESEPIVEAEPEPNVMTLDDYLAKRNEARANSEIFGEIKTRQVEADFSGLTKKQADDLGNWGGFGMNKDDGKAKAKEQRSMQKTQVLDVAFKNAALEPKRDDDRPRTGGRGEGRGGRGGRGGDRERGEGRGGGRGGDRGSGRGGRGERRPQSAGGISRGVGKIDLSDANAFPSL